MPEKIETEIVARELDVFVKGKSLVNIKVNDKSRYFESGIEDSDLMSYPSKFVKVYSRGKRIVFELENCYFLSFLGMTGKWVYAPEKHSGILLKLISGDLSAENDTIEKFDLYFDDVRPLGYFKIFKAKEDLDEYLNKTIGPDWLHDNITLEYFTKQIKNKRRGKSQICAFLLCQKSHSGLGNYLKCEILYRSKIRPDRELKDISNEEIRVLYDTILATLQEALKANGLTIKNYISPSGVIGTFQCIVYGKNGGKDPNGNDIIKQKFKDGRTTYWCKEVQK